MKKITCLLSLLYILITPSCSDVLDITPTDKYPDPLVWEDENLLKMYVNEQYAGIGDKDNYYEILYFSDDNYCKYNRGGVNIVRDNILTADNVEGISDILQVWKQSYKYIQNINVFFEKIEDSPVDEALKTNLKAEIKFIRAYLYAKLIWGYGGVPIIEEVYDINSSWTGVKRNTWEECVKYILKDLEDVIATLPDFPEERNRASANAARALKSRVLLYDASPLNNPTGDKQKWQRAADAAADLFNRGYTLATDYRKMFVDVDCSEFIFSKEFSETYESKFTLWMGPAGDNGRAWITPSLNLVDAYETIDGEIPVINSELGTVNSNSLYDPANPYANRDPRFYASVYHNGSDFGNRTIETFIGGYDMISVDATMTGFYLRKFIEEEVGLIEDKKYTGPFVLFRLSEMYLNYAEAQYHLGNEEAAREYINKIRSREGVEMPPVTVSGQALLEKIQHERFIELAFEGHRYFDIRRWKIAEKVETTHIMGVKITKEANGTFSYERYSLTPESRKTDWKDAYYRLPISFSEIQKSNNSLEQNPGYEIK